VKPVSSYGYPQLFGHCDDFVITTYTIPDQNFMYVSLPVLQKIKKLSFDRDGTVKLDKTIELPQASSPHGITLSRKYLYVCLNDLSSVYMYIPENYFLFKKMTFDFPISCHSLYTFDDVTLYIIQENSDLYAYNSSDSSMKKLTKDFKIAFLSASPGEQKFVTNVYTTNSMQCLNKKNETGVLLIEDKKEPLFIPFSCTFQDIGIQGVHFTPDLIYVCFLSGNVFGYIDLDTFLNVSFQTQCQIFHFIDLRYCVKYDILFLISTSIVANSCDALVYINNFRKKYPFQGKTQEFSLSRSEYNYIMFPMSVSLHRINFLYNQENIIISQARSGKIAYFPTRAFQE
jgi:hypothetical protein